MRRAELSDLLYHCGRIGVPVIGIEFQSGILAVRRRSTAALVMPECGEASEEAPAPTISTTMCLALGDALAVALLKARGFTADHFGAIHPGGNRGRRAQARARFDARRRERSAHSAGHVHSGYAEGDLARVGIGAAGVVENGKLIGIVTDGDLRRKLTREMFDRYSRAIS